MQGGEKDCAQRYQRRAQKRLLLETEAEDGTGREGGMVLLPAPPAAQPPGRGAAPALPDHPGRAWQGRTRPPHASPTSGALPCITRPRRVRGRRSGRRAHRSLKLPTSSLPRLPPLRLPAPEPGRPMPAPAPPAWLHKVAEKPPPAPGLKGGAAGTLPPGGQRRSGHAPGVRD